jgi:hypothetical protein
MLSLRTLLVPLMAIALPAAVGCGPSRTVTRTSEAVDLSGNWNDVDADQVAQTMIAQFKAEAGERLAAWSSSHGGNKPVLRLYPIKNRSSEHINHKYFTKQVERALLNTGMVRVVSSLEEAVDQRIERMDQATHASDDTVKSQGNETASDFVLNGWIITENDAVEGKQVRAYVTTMELTDSSNNEKCWIGEKKIKKVIEQASAGW